MSLVGAALAAAGCDPECRTIALVRSATRGVFLAFAPGAAEPSVVLKLDTASDSGAPFAIEAANLALLAACDLPAGSTPRLLFHGVVEGAHVLVETALPGVRLKNLAPRVLARRPVQRATLWELLEWHGQASRALARRLPEGASARDEVESFFARYAASPGVRALLDDAVALDEDEPLPRALVHGDLCTANVLMDARGSLAVIDWEYPICRSWLTTDILHFLASLTGETSIHALNGVTKMCLEDGPRTRATAALGWTLLANRKADELARRGLALSDDAATRAHAPLVAVRARHCLPLEALA